MSGAVKVDAAIAGAGIIGLSLGLELLRRGLTVAIVERGHAMAGASWAAAGMLAVDDPQNPPQLLPLARCSRQLYPEFLARVEELSSLRIPLRTRKTLQYTTNSAGIATPAEFAELAPALHPGGHAFILLNEASLDPRDLCHALPKAFLRAGGLLLEATHALGIEAGSVGAIVRTDKGPISAATFINCCGAWSGDPQLGPLPVTPVKGLMLNLQAAPHQLTCAVRAPGIYLVPRGDGRIAVGATIEHVGFDDTIANAAIERLTHAALKLLPEVSVPLPSDAWAGFRPGTPDGLPILGPAAQPHCWHATGHYRDGILLAPATARAISQAILGDSPEVSLGPFSPARF